MRSLPHSPQGRPTCSRLFCDCAAPRAYIDSRCYILICVCQVHFHPEVVQSNHSAHYIGNISSHVSFWLLNHISFRSSIYQAFHLYQVVKSSSSSRSILASHQPKVEHSSQVLSKFPSHPFGTFDLTSTCAPTSVRLRANWVWHSSRCFLAAACYRVEEGMPKQAVAFLVR